MNINKSSFCRIWRPVSGMALAGILFLSFSVQAFAWEPTLPKDAQGPVSWYQNGKDGRYYVPVVQGRVFKPAIGLVRTDSNCRPDAQGLSHCFNRIQLVSGEVITIQNTHKMSSYRCLRVGEYVKLQPNGSSSWVIIQTESGS